MERANYNWANYEDSVKSHDQDDQEMEYRPRYDADPDDDYDDDDNEEEDYDEGVQEEVEHRTDEAEDDADQDGFHEQFGWRSRTRHRRGHGRFVPPDTRGLAAPVFVRQADPGAKTQGRQEKREPEYER